VQLSDLRELKTYLDLDQGDATEDVKLLFLIEQASAWIEDYLDRPLTYKQRTEYYNGKGTRKLPLRARPVYVGNGLDPVVVIDNGGGCGQIPGSFTGTGLTYGKDFFPLMDGDTPNTSRSGILIRNNAMWPKPAFRVGGLLTPYQDTGFGVIQVTYWAGFTYDNMPSQLRMACHAMVARMRFLFPVGMELGSDSYGEKSINILAERKGYVFGGDLVKGMLNAYKNWTFSV